MHTHTCARATCSIFCAGCLRDGMLDRVNFKHFVMPYPNYYHLGCGKRLFFRLYAKNDHLTKTGSGQT